MVEKTLHQFGMGGKRDIKQYWRSLSTRHSQLMEGASQQVDQWKKTIVSNKVIQCNLPIVTTYGLLNCGLYREVHGLFIQVIIHGCNHLGDMSKWPLLRGGLNKGWSY